MEAWWGTKRQVWGDDQYTELEFRRTFHSRPLTEPHELDADRYRIRRRPMERECPFVTRWTLDPIFSSGWLAAGLVLLLGLSLLVPIYKSISRRKTSILRSLRCLVIALMAVAMLRPTLINTSNRPQVSTLLIAVDGSRSMQIPDAGAGKTRWEAQRDILQQAAPDLERVASRVELEFFRFDGQAAAVAYQDGKLELKGEPDGDSTDIGRTLDQLVRDSLGRRLAGIILMSDGAQRVRQPRVDIQSAARRLARLGQPLYTVPFGQPRDQSQARDISVESFPDQHTVFVKNQLDVTGMIRTQGFTNKQIPVELVITAADGESIQLGPVRISPDANDQLAPVRFNYSPTEVGQYRLTLRVPAQPGEFVTDNNTLHSYLTVLDGGLRVLYLHGSIVGGQRIDRDAIAISPNVELDARWIDSRLRDRWPLDLSEELAGAEPYDVVLLGDLDADALGADSCDRIVAAVQSGQGLMMLGGYRSFGPGGYASTSLEELLPVNMDRLERQDFASAFRTDVHLQGEVRVVVAQPHFLTNLRDGDERGSVWQELPPLYGANRFRGIRDNAVALLATPQGQPLLVASRYGQGRVLAFAAESVARWARFGFQAEHQRFWRQVILWLAQKEDTDREGIWIRLDRRRFDRGETVEFRCGAGAAESGSSSASELNATITRPDGTQVPVELTSEGSEYRGRYKLDDDPGEYCVRVSVAAGQLEPEERAFSVLQRDLELVDPVANPRQLEQLAKLTSDFGGRLVPPEQFSGLLTEIANQPPRTEIEVESKWQLADTTSDAWSFFLLAIGLLSMEWYLRKRWNLV